MTSPPMNHQYDSSIRCILVVDGKVVSMALLLLLIFGKTLGPSLYET